MKKKSLARRGFLAVDGLIMIFLGIVCLYPMYMYYSHRYPIPIYLWHIEDCCLLRSKQIWMHIRLSWIIL